jgi:cation transport protein ChaC
MEAAEAQMNARPSARRRDPVDPVDPASAAVYPRLTPAQLAASLETTLARWNGRAPLWVFGYGSLIWKPELEFDRRVPARVFGYHRRLCLRSVTYRGTIDCPGLVAGLDRGGSCAGVLYRLSLRGLRAQLARLWEREMFLGSYVPRWLSAMRLDARDGRRETVAAIAFVVRRDARNYCPPMHEDAIVDVLRNACGRYGTSLEYLQHTVTALRELGLRDPHLERLAHIAAAPMIGSRIADE